jgi:HK97 family phage major capsid protein
MGKTFELKGLRERKGQLLEELVALRSVLKRENRPFNDDELRRFNSMQLEMAEVNERIRNAESGEDRGVNGGVNGGVMARVGRDDFDGQPRRRDRDDDGECDQRQISAAFRGWVKAQWERRPTASERAACQSLGVKLKQRTFAFKLRSGIQKRAMAVGATSGGGGVVARGFMNALEVAMQSYSNVRGVCREITTDTGADLDWPTFDDTGVTGEQIGEGEEVSFEDPGIGDVVFKAFKTSSKGCLISSELLNDSAFDLDTLLGDAIGTRIGRQQGSKFTNGSGTGEPQGIVTAATLGLTSASPTAIAPAELTRLIFSIDSSYRNSPSFGLMMHDTTIAYLFSLKDTNGQPIYRPTFANGTARLVIDGYNVYPNSFMDPCNGAGGIPVTAKKHVLAGAMDRFVIRDAGQLRVRRLDERYAEKDQVGFIGFLRSDSRMVKSGVIKYLQQA